MRKLAVITTATLALIVAPNAEAHRHHRHHRVVCYWVSEPLPPTNAFIFESAGEVVPDQDITLTYWHCA